MDPDELQESGDGPFVDDFDDDVDVEFEVEEGEEDFHDDLELNHSQEIRRQKSFEILTEEILSNNAKEMKQEVKDLLAVKSSSAAQILLRHYKWNKDKLIQEYSESNKKAKEIRKSAGISSLSLEKKMDKTEQRKKIECPICLEDVRGKDSYALGCGHRYCNKCWRNYLELKVKTEADCVTSHCPFPKCTEVVHDRAFKKILPKDTFKSYERFVFRSLVSENPSLKFCPAPGCTNAVRVDRKNRREAVKCECGFRWCFQCADYENGDHMPATCENVDAWKQKATDESENVRWLIANTKKCPTCRKPIEKNGGCMHMTCRKQSGGCGHEFCWLCRGPWTEHGSETGGYYACNKYDVSKAKAADDKASSVKTELEAYMFYYHRYESHHNAMKIADEQRQNAERKSSDILDLFQVRAQDTQFLKEATEQLLDDRRVLKWSYVYGFYLDKSNTKERNLFEYLQEDLEKHTNKLSELYEIPLAKLKNDYHKFVQWKEQVTNYTRVTAGFLAKFVEGVSRGLTDESG